MSETKGRTQSGKDRDGNRWEVARVHDQDRSAGRQWRVAIHADGCWLTRPESIRLARALHSAIVDVALKNKRRTRGACG